MGLLRRFKALKASSGSNPFKSIRWMAFGLVLVSSGWAQSNVDQNSTTPNTIEERNKEPGPGRQIGSGAATIGTGAAKGTGDLAKGTAKGIGKLATLHPIDAGVSVGKGAGAAGKDVTVGTVKGTGKVTKGIGRGLKKIL
jgi:hypothetical protein